MKLLIKFIRSVVVLSYFVLFGVGAGIISFILFPLVNIFAKKENRKLYYSNIVQYAWKFCTWLFSSTKMITLKIENEEALKQLSGQIIVASHPSLIDIVILISLIPKSICLAKQSLMNNFLLKNILQNLYITNDVDIEEFKTNALNALNDGYNVVIFPTGKRFRQGDDIKIRKGAAMLAIAANKPVVPINIKCSYDFLQINQPIYECGSEPVVFDIKLMPEINVPEICRDSNGNGDLHINHAGGQACPPYFAEGVPSEIVLRNLISKRIKESIS